MSKQLNLRGQVLSEKDRLKIIRGEYYKTLLADLKALEIKKRDMIKRYNINVAEIDKQLKRLK